MTKESVLPALCVAFLLFFTLAGSPCPAAAAASASPAAGVFGPEVCIRGKGGPVLQEFGFSAAEPERVFVLEVVNGGLEDDEYEKVSSSEITLNGVQVLGPKNFSRNVDRLAVPVSLANENVLGVEVRGKPGGAVAITIEPALVVEVPEEGKVFGSRPIEVSGRLFGEPAEVTLNGAAIVTGDGLFAFNGIDIEEGPNTLCVSASWGDGLSAEECFEVILDTAPPVIAVDNPSDGTVSREPSVALMGSVSDTVGLQSVEMAVNGSPAVPLALDGGGRFSEIVELAAGLNTISVKGIDGAGNESVEVRSVVFQTGGTGGSPITILSPADGDVISGRRVDVYGTYEAPVEQIQMWNVGQEVGAGKFYIPGMPIGEGATMITVRGEDGERNKYEASVEVLCTSPDEPVEVVADPEGGPSPLMVTFSLRNNTGESIAQCEADFLGTGDYVPLPECATGLRYTYGREDLWQPSFRVTTSGGHRFTAYGAVSVHGPAVLESAFPAEDPVDLDIDGEGKLYVLEGAPARVRVVDGEGTDIVVFGSPGSGQGEFSNPSGISVGGDGRIYVSDSGNDRVQVFAPDGTFLSSWGYPGSRIGEIRGPGGIDVRHDGEIALANRGNGRVSLFREDGYFENDSCTGELAEPWDVIWSGTNVVVTDRAGGTVKICPDGAGTPIPWDGDLPPLGAPRGLIYDAANRYYLVADEELDRVTVFKDFRRMPVFIRHIESLDGDDTGLRGPVAVARGTSPVEDEYYIADRGNGRIVKVVLSKGAEGDAPLQVWSDLRDALESRDIEKALLSFMPRSREVYRQVLTEVADQLAVIAADMGDLMPLSVTEYRSVYGVLRYDDDKPFLFDVVFVRDGTGSWKVLHW